MGSAIYQHELATGIHVALSLRPPSSPPQPSRLSQSIGFGFPVSYTKLPLAIYFTYANVYVPNVIVSNHPPPSPTVSKSLSFTSVSPLLSCT